VSTTDYALWFVNNYSIGVNVCVYQDIGNVTKSGIGSLDALAWMVTGANSGSQVKFIWTTRYQYVWFAYGPPLTQAFLAATLSSQVTLSKNTFGYQFSAPAQGNAGQFSIAMDTSIPPVRVSEVVAGIGMDGAGTLAVAASPNISVGFTPVSDAGLVYWISAGYSGSVNDIIVPSGMNAPQKIAYPPGIVEITAQYNADGTWTVSNGPPNTSGTKQSVPNVAIYRPGAPSAAATNAAETPTRKR
jgi:hypothetical protein